MDRLDRLPPPDPIWRDLESGALLRDCPAWVPLAGTQVIRDDGRPFRVVLAGDAYPEDGGVDWINVDDGGHYTPNPTDPGTQGVLAALLLINGVTMPKPPRTFSHASVREWGGLLTRALVGRPACPWRGATDVAFLSHSSKQSIDQALQDLNGRFHVEWVRPGRHRIVVMEVDDSVSPDELQLLKEALQKLSKTTGYRAPTITAAEGRFAHLFQGAL